MGTTVARLQALVSAETETAEGNLKRVSGQFDKTAQSAKNSAGGLSKVNDALSQIGLGISVAAIGAAVLGLGKQVLQLGMDAEQTKVAFTTMLGSTDAAMQMLGSLRDFAAQTPFQFTELTAATKRMLAFGFSAQDIIPMLTNIGDAVSGLGLGAEGVNRVTLALGQMQAKGKVSGEEMLQLTEAGIPAWRYLAESMGVSTAEVMKLSEKGLIPAKQAIDAVLAGMQGDFGGMMAKQAETAAGQISNLADKLEALGTSLGEDMLPVMKAFTDALASATGAALILVTTGDLIDNALADQDKALTSTSASYTEYVSQMTQLEVNAGRMTEAARDEYLAHKDVADIMARLTKEYGELTPLKMYDLIQTGKLTEQQAEYILDLQKQPDTFNEITASLKLKTEAQWEDVRAAETAARATQSLADNWQGLGEQYQKRAADAAVATQATLTTADAMAVLKAGLSGVIGKANQDLASSQIDLTAQASKLETEIAKLSTTQGQTYTVAAKNSTLAQLELANAQFDAESAVIKLSEAQKKLSENTDPDKQRALQGSLLDAQLAVETSKEKVGKYGEELGTATTYTVDHTKEIDVLKGKLASINGELLANQLAHRMKTRQAIFDMLEEGLIRENLKKGQQGLTDVQIIAMQKLGVEWGLVDKASADANIAIIKGIQEANGNVDVAIQKAKELTDAYLGIPKRIDIAINANYTRTGDEDFGGWTPPTPTSKPAGKPVKTTTEPEVTYGGAKAAGGNVWSDEWYWVGENGPEPFRPSTAGTITPAEQATAGGITIQFSGPVTMGSQQDVEQLAYMVVREIQRKTR